MPPPIIIHDMHALEHRRQENLRAARERARRRLQEEAKEEERRLDPHPPRQSVQDHDLVPCVGVEVLHEQRRNNSPYGKPYCHQQENNILDQHMAEYCPGKVAALKSRFETPQEGQSQHKKKRCGFSPGASDREGIYAQIDETQMMDFNPPKQQEEIIKRTVASV